MPFILEGLVSSTRADGSPHLAPMGPEVDAAMDQLVLKPFQTSTTYQNLKRSGRRSVSRDRRRRAIGPLGDRRRRAGAAVARRRSPAQGDWILADACRWYAFRVVSIDDSQERVRMEAEVIETGRLRDFCGFNRRSMPCSKRRSWPRASTGCPQDEIFAQLDVCGRWSKRPAAPPRACLGVSGPIFSRPLWPLNRPARRLGDRPAMSPPRRSSSCPQPIAFRADVVWRFRASGNLAAWA